MILIDEPVWPAHGTLWGHVVSDRSLEELHAFARVAGLPARGFDHDHYDYPRARRDDLVAAGAVLVDSTLLMRRLTAAGLRVRPAQKTPSRAVAGERLRAAWNALLPDHETAEVARLVRLTASHDPAPGDARGAQLVDADLAILGALPGRYHV